MENARATAIFLITLLVIMYYVVFCTTPKQADNIEDTVRDQGTMKGTDNTLAVEFQPVLSIPVPNVSANRYAGMTPRF